MGAHHCSHHRLVNSIHEASELTVSVTGTVIALEVEVGSRSRGVDFGSWRTRIRQWTELERRVADWQSCLFWNDTPCTYSEERVAVDDVILHCQ